MRRLRDLRPAAALLLVALGLGACFERPIRERLELHLARGQAIVHLQVELGPWPTPEERPAIFERLRTSEEELLRGWDPWSPRFAGLGSNEEVFAWRREEGHLRSLEREAVVPSASGLSNFFGDTPIRIAWSDDDFVGSLSLFPGPTETTRSERDELDAALTEWSKGLEAYLASTHALWAWLEDHPDRAEACFGALFETDENPVLSPEEERLLTALVDTLSSAWSILVAHAGEARSIDELSRRVFDPFPAELTVATDGTVYEAIGFAEGEGRWEVPEQSFWAALSRLEGTWVEPDPLLAWVRHDLSGTEDPFPTAAFAQKARSSIPVDAEEIEGRLRGELIHPGEYRLSWRW